MPSGVRGIGARVRASAVLAGVVAAVTAVSLLGPASPAGAVQLPQVGLVGSNPANVTPNVLDGAVHAITRIGSRMYVGGTFTQVAPAGSTTGTARPYLFAIDAATGGFDPTFAVALDGAVNALVPTPDGTGLYVGGEFANITENGVATRSKGVVLVDAVTGARRTSFKPAALNGNVSTMVLSNGRLFIGGNFTKLAANLRTAVATLNATTGFFDPYLDLQLSGIHNSGVTHLERMDISPDGTKLVVVGNFKNAVGGAVRDQIAVADLGPTATLSSWTTDRYAPTCSRSFDTYMRDVEFSPDGSFFVVVTTGAGFSGTLCDASARWETATSGPGQQPTWVNYSGGDTFTAVGITADVVYVGGHFRWQNNPFGRDSLGQGGVARAGIAALDPRNGLPLSWNPGRQRGYGVWELYATPEGLWVGSDTDRIGGELRARLAFFPLAGGSTLPTDSVGELPNALVSLGGYPPTNTTILNRVNGGGPLQATADNGPDWARDDASGPSPLHNAGSTAVTWSTPVRAVSSAVPSTVPRALFDTERADPAGGQEMQWNLPVSQAGQYSLRLFFANRCTCTSKVGQRKFDVTVNGTTVLSNYDIVADVGDQVGTMKAFPVTMSGAGTIVVRFVHRVENPLVNGIELVRTDIPAPDPSVADTVSSRNLAADGTVGTSNPLGTGGVAWRNTRGAFMVDSTLFTGWSDGTLQARTFSGTVFGAPATVDLHGLSSFAAELQTVTGMFFQGGRLYFTLAGSNKLYYRYFTPESRVVGATRFEAPLGAGLDYSAVQGMFLTPSSGAPGGTLWWASKADGLLRNVAWTPAAGAAGAVTVVSAPGVDWRTRGMFLRPGGPTSNKAPVAQASVSCANVSCAFDASSSFDPDGTVASYLWDFGDGTTSTEPQVSHSYSPGTYTVTLTVTDNEGASASVQTQAESVPNVPPTAAMTMSCFDLRCTFSGTGSTDSDGRIVGYAWDFGDGGADTGPTVTHTFPSTGTYDVSLTVTDDADATGTARSNVNLTVPQGVIGFRAATRAVGNVTSLRVTVPTTVQPGDGMLLFVDNGGTAAITVPAGWTPVRRVTSGGVSSGLWMRSAVAGDAGSAVTVASALRQKYDVQLLAYSGVAATPVASAVSRNEASGLLAHTTPTATATTAGTWAVSYWTQKSSAVSATVWTPPSGVSVRGTVAGSGSGRVDSLAADSGAGINASSYGAKVASVNEKPGAAVTWTVLLAPAP